MRAHLVSATGAGGGAADERAEETGVWAEVAEEEEEEESQGEEGKEEEEEEEGEEVVDGEVEEEEDEEAGENSFNSVPSQNASTSARVKPFWRDAGRGCSPTARSTARCVSSALQSRPTSTEVRASSAVSIVFFVGMGMHMHCT